MMAVAAQKLRIFIATFLIVLMFAPLQANAQTEPRSYLTLEILQEKTTNLIQLEGRDTVSIQVSKREKWLHQRRKLGNVTVR